MAASSLLHLVLLETLHSPPRSASRVALSGDLIFWHNVKEQAIHYRGRVFDDRVEFELSFDGNWGRVVDCPASPCSAFCYSIFGR